jgi:RHS repeat-associated protein
LKNNYLYQGAYAELDEDIGWTDFALRNYDAQIGRWVQQDPYQQFASPYVGMGDDPINLIDPSGGLSWPPGGVTNLLSKSGETVSKALNISGQVTKAANTLNKVSVLLHAVTAAVNIIGNGVNTKQVGIFLHGYDVCCFGARRNVSPNAKEYGGYLQEGLGSSYKVSVLELERKVTYRIPTNIGGGMTGSTEAPNSGKEKYHQICIERDFSSSESPTPQQENMYNYMKKVESSGFDIQDLLSNNIDGGPYSLGNPINSDLYVANDLLRRFDETNNPILKSWHIFYLGMTLENNSEFEKATGIRVNIIRRPKPDKNLANYNYTLTIQGASYTVNIKFFNSSEENGRSVFKNGASMKIKIKNRRAKKTNTYYSK